MIKTVQLKIGNMRKPQEFVVYPQGPDGDDITIKAQSDDCILVADRETGKGRWVRNRGGAYFLHLSIGGNIGQGELTLTAEQLGLLKAAQARQGDSVIRVL